MRNVCCPNTSYRATDCVNQTKERESSVKRGFARLNKYRKKHIDQSLSPVHNRTLFANTFIQLHNDIQYHTE